MRKIILILVAIISFMGCAKDGKPSDIKDSKWIASFSGHPVIVEFVSKNQVRSYRCDENYNYKSWLFEGTYQQSGKELVFTDFKVPYDEDPRTIIKGKVEGDVMELETKYDTFLTFMLLK